MEHITTKEGVDFVSKARDGGFDCVGACLGLMCAHARALPGPAVCFRLSLSLSLSLSALCLQRFLLLFAPQLCEDRYTDFASVLCVFLCVCGYIRRLRDHHSAASSSESQRALQVSGDLCPYARYQDQCLGCVQKCALSDGVVKTAITDKEGCVRITIAFRS